MATMQAQLLEKIYDEVDGATANIKKVTIVGVGQVGMACAYSIMQQVFIALHSYSFPGKLSNCTVQG